MSKIKASFFICFIFLHFIWSKAYRSEAKYISSLIYPTYKLPLLENNKSFPYSDKTNAQATTPLQVDNILFGISSIGILFLISSSAISTIMSESSLYFLSTVSFSQTSFSFTIIPLCIAQILFLITG